MAVVVVFINVVVVVVVVVDVAVLVVAVAVGVVVVAAVVDALVFTHYISFRALLSTFKHRYLPNRRRRTLCFRLPCNYNYNTPTTTVLNAKSIDLCFSLVVDALSALVPTKPRK